MGERPPIPRPEFEHEAILNEAIGLQKNYEADAAIWQALSNFNIQTRSERTQLFKLIKAEIKKRAHREEKQRKEEDALIEEDRRETMLRDAWAHQMRQPRDTWDNSYDPDED